MRIQQRHMESHHHDVRDKPRLSHEDVLALNFIKAPSPYVFRRHYRSGLRSHIMEVLDPADLEKEKSGVLAGGVRCFPKARPIRMLRIFRRRFVDLLDATEELKRVKTIEAYLAPRHLARSDEFLVDYLGTGARDIILCGLQEFVEGEIVDPWRSLEERQFSCLLKRMGQEISPSQGAGESMLRDLRDLNQGLVAGIRKMILERHCIPDLAGLGNLLLTPSGHIKLVDINNISRVSPEGPISTDDRGYPVCDKSIQAFSLLEQWVIGRPLDAEDRIYLPFLNPERMRMVRELEERFHRSMGADASWHSRKQSDE